MNKGKWMGKDSIRGNKNGLSDHAAKQLYRGGSLTTHLQNMLVKLDQIGYCKLRKFDASSMATIYFGVLKTHLHRRLLGSI